MKIVVADRIDKEGIRKLQDLGCEVNYKADLEGEELVRAVAEVGCQILLVRDTPVTAAVMQASKELSLIICVGEEYDNIDLQAASEESVFVANCPNQTAAAAAELTMGLMLALDRRIPDHVAWLREGRWARRELSKSRGLKGRTLGVIGTGLVSQLVVKRARAFEMNIIGWGPRLTTEKANELNMIRLDLPEEVAATCDILTVHLPYLPDTEQFIGSNIFEEMKAGSYFINTSRAEVVDFKALAKAVVEKGLRVALDSFPQQPLEAMERFDHPIVKLDGVVYGTHHIAELTEQAKQAAAEEAAAIIKEFLATGHVRNCVNISRGRVPHSAMVVRLRNRPGVLAKVLTVLAKYNINVREMENVMCDGERSASAQIRLDSKVDPAVLRELQTVDPENILGVTLTHPGF
ncbi:MAG: Glyoxylate/hydroxypyruvate reductase B [Phycisphaerae bacterium]|nr:Glyoxylate/hydroxypyruvate reductase B [Phycisphaerae bacterium]